MIANDNSKTFCSEILVSWPGNLNEQADPRTIRSADAPLLPGIERSAGEAF